jgi:hypothetical protein
MYSYWKKGLLALTLVFALNLGSAKAQVESDPEQDQSLVIGSGDIVGGNVSEARSMAVSEALLKGVEGYLAELLGSQDMANHFPRLLQDIIPKAKEWIANYYILAEERMNGHYKVLVRVKVNDKVIEEKLREIGIELMDRPPIKVLFLVYQIEYPEGELSYWWQAPEADFAMAPVELALHNVFEARGFHPVNRLLNVPEGEYSSEMNTLELTDEDAVAWGRLFSADVVIRGRCKIVQGIEIGLELEALHVENGSLIDWGMEVEKMEETPADVDQVVETIERLVNNVAAQLSPRISSAIQTKEATLKQLELVLQGVRNFRQFRVFKDFLENGIPGVESVKQTRIRDNDMSISVEFFGDENRFLDMISTQESLSFSTDVKKTEEGKIHVVIRQYTHDYP